MSTLPMENNASSRVAKLLEMAQNATNEGKKEDAVKCYQAILQIDPKNVEADFYTFLLTSDYVHVCDPHISEYFNTLISKFQALLKKIKEKNLSTKEWLEIERIWHDIRKNSFETYYQSDHLTNEILLKEIQGHSIWLEAAEKVGDCIIAEFPQHKDIAVKVWGYEVGVMYQSITKLKKETKYDPDTIDIWEGNKMSYDIYKVARKILEINNKYISPYTECPQEIKEFFLQSKKEAEEKSKAEKKRLKILVWLCVLIIVIIWIWSHLS